MSKGRPVRAAPRDAEPALDRAPVPAPDADASYSGLPVQQGKFLFILTAIPVDDLYPWCFVPTREDDARRGFQRALTPKRADEIAAYLNDGQAPIPSTITLSAQACAHFAWSTKNKMMSFKRREEGSFLVIDGQHRLEGYYRASARSRVPVSICFDLERFVEATTFEDINTRQKPVSASLIADIKALTMRENEREGALRELFDALAADPKLLVGRETTEDPAIRNAFSPFEAGRGRITRPTFARAVMPALASGVLAGCETKTRAGLLRNYLNALHLELEAGTGGTSALTRASFLGAVFDVFDEVARAAKAVHGHTRVDALRAVVRPLAALPYANPNGSGLLSKKVMVPIMQAALRARTTISKDDL